MVDLGFHATTKENKLSILKDGFSTEKQGVNGNHFGSGVYLAATKKLARCYGSHIVHIEYDNSEIFHLKNWHKDYMIKCQETFDNGIPEGEVNTVVGEHYKNHYMSQGYKGIMIDSVMGTSKEIVIYDTSIIFDVF